MMVVPRLTNCPGCTSENSIDKIIPVLEEIDCKLAQLGASLYFNMVFMINKPISRETLIDLLMYRRILLYKYVNSDYAGEEYTIDKIISKIKLLKYR